jgi:hypothetical protein
MRETSSGRSGSRHCHRTGQFAAIQAAAPALGVELSTIGVRDAGEIEGSIAGSLW